MAKGIYGKFCKKSKRKKYLDSWAFRAFLTRSIPANIRHRIHLGEQGQYSFIYANGTRCEEKRWLDIHNIIPVSHGGTNSPDNLKIFCSNHLKVMHIQN